MDEMTTEYSKNRVKTIESPDQLYPDIDTDNVQNSIHNSNMNIIYNIFKDYFMFEPTISGSTVILNNIVEHVYIDVINISNFYEKICYANANIHNDNTIIINPYTNSSFSISLTKPNFNPFTLNIVEKKVHIFCNFFIISRIDYVIENSKYIDNYLKMETTPELIYDDIQRFNEKDIIDKTELCIKNPEIIFELIRLNTKNDISNIYSKTINKIFLEIDNMLKSDVENHMLNKIILLINDDKMEIYKKMIEYAYCLEKYNHIYEYGLKFMETTIAKLLFNKFIPNISLYNIVKPNSVKAMLCVATLEFFILEKLGNITPYKKNNENISIMNIKKINSVESLKGCNKKMSEFEKVVETLCIKDDDKKYIKNFYNIFYILFFELETRKCHDIKIAYMIKKFCTISTDFLEMALNVYNKIIMEQICIKIKEKYLCIAHELFVPVHIVNKYMKNKLITDFIMNKNTQIPIIKKNYVEKLDNISIIDFQNAFVFLIEIMLKYGLTGEEEEPCMETIFQSVLCDIRSYNSMNVQKKDKDKDKDKLKIIKTDILSTFVNDNKIEENGVDEILTVQQFIIDLD